MIGRRLTVWWRARKDPDVFRAVSWAFYFVGLGALATNRGADAAALVAVACYLRLCARDAGADNGVTFTTTINNTITRPTQNDDAVAKAVQSELARQWNRARRATLAMSPTRDAD